LQRRTAVKDSLVGPPPRSELPPTTDRTASVIGVLVDDIDRLAREVKDMKSAPPSRKRRIGFVIADD
jgi:hypothetical protein